MKLKKTIRGAILIVIFGLMLALAITFLLASMVPQDYEPRQLTQQERQNVARKFANKAINDLLNKFEDVKPFTHTITEDELNHYLASLDEIAFLRLGKKNAASKSTELFEAMDKAGFLDPMVKMDDGVLTIMVQTRSSKKVISLDLSFMITDDGRLTVNLEQVRIGRMPVPQFIISEGLEALQKTLPQSQSGKLNRMSVRNLDLMIATIIGSIGETPIPTKIAISRKKPKQLRRIDIEDGELKLHFVPAEPK
ncbi:MAG: hypothetical protein K8S55_03135 [Phycisphaerae bacterium]|nr:hypothetical protein [Phycisphaerae bacterium]